MLAHVYRQLAPFERDRRAVECMGRAESLVSLEHHRFPETPNGQAIAGDPIVRSNRKSNALALANLVDPNPGDRLVAGSPIGLL